MSENAQVAYAERLTAALEGKNPSAIIASACEAFPDRVAVVSSFGADSAVLLQAVAAIDRALPVIFLDTHLHFAQTLQYRDQLARYFGLRDVRTVLPTPEERERRDADDRLWQTDIDACCQLRKVRPLAEALAPFSAWISGRKRFQAATRISLPLVEWDGTHFKFNPLAMLTETEIESYFADASLPTHPMRAQGYKSIGCWPCTAPVRNNEDVRAGRWRGAGKIECGIHRASTSEKTV